MYLCICIRKFVGQQALSIFLHVRVADVSHVSQAECKEYSASVASNCDSTTLTSLLMYQLSHITRSFWIQSKRTIQPKGVEVKNFKRSCNTIIHIRSKTMISTVSTKILLASISACESSLANAKRINTIVPNKTLITILIFIFVLIFTIHTTNAFLPHYGWYFSALQHTHTHICVRTYKSGLTWTPHVWGAQDEMMAAEDYSKEGGTTHEFSRRHPFSHISHSFSNNFPKSRGLRMLS